VRVAIELEKALLVGELEGVEHEAVRVRERMSAQDVHAERRQHTADIGEEEGLVERRDSQTPHRAFPLERQVHLVGLDVARQPDMTVDRLPRKDMQIPLRQPFEETTDFTRRISTAGTL